VYGTPPRIQRQKVPSSQTLQCGKRHNIGHQFFPKALLPFFRNDKDIRHIPESGIVGYHPGKTHLRRAFIDSETKGVGNRFFNDCQGDIFGPIGMTQEIVNEPHIELRFVCRNDRISCHVLSSFGGFPKKPPTPLETFLFSKAPQFIMKPVRTFCRLSGTAPDQIGFSAQAAFRGGPVDNSSVESIRSFFNKYRYFCWICAAASSAVYHLPFIRSETNLTISAAIPRSRGFQQLRAAQMIFRYRNWRPVPQRSGLRCCPTKIDFRTDRNDAENHHGNGAEKGNADPIDNEPRDFSEGYAKICKTKNRYR